MEVGVTPLCKVGGRAGGAKWAGGQYAKWAGGVAKWAGGCDKVGEGVPENFADEEAILATWENVWFL